MRETPKVKSNARCPIAQLEFYEAAYRSCVSFNEAEYKQLEDQDEILSMEVNVCFTYNRAYKYGLGLGFAELASMDFEYAKNCQKVFEAKVGKRVILNDPDRFFARVLQQPETLKKLTSWLTVAKSAWLFYRATFQQPRVYCCIGYYELSRTTSRITHGGEFPSELSVSPEVIAIASGGLPIGGTIGPFANGQSLEANFSAPKPGIWAARYHRLRVRYLQLVTQGTTQLPQSIMLKPDCTHPRGGPMGDAHVVEESRVMQTEDEIQNAQGAVVTLETATEIGDESQDEKYWEVFREAEDRLDPRHDAELDAGGHVDSTDDESNG